MGMVRSFNADNSSDTVLGDSIYKDLSQHCGSPDKKVDMVSFIDGHESDGVLDETVY